MRFLAAAVLFAAALAGPARALAPEDLTDAERARYETVKADTQAAASFLATRGHVRDASALAARRDDKELANAFKRPKNFDKRYLVTGDSAVINEAVKISLTALAETLYSDSRCPAAATPAEADAFLKSIGPDPASEDVALAKADGEIKSTYLGDPVAYSVASLAGEKRKNALTSFVATRAFVARLKKSFDSTPLPKTNYEAAFLTGAERQLVGTKVASSLQEMR